MAVYMLLSITLCHSAVPASILPAPVGITHFYMIYVLNGMNGHLWSTSAAGNRVWNVS